MARENESLSDIFWSDKNRIDQLEADSKEKAVFVGKQATGKTIAIGQEEKQEWIKVDNIDPISVDENR